MKRLSVFFILLITGLLHAEEKVYLKTGKVLNGTIIEETAGAITIADKNNIKATLSREDIKNIDFGYDRQSVEQLDPGRPENYYRQAMVLLTKEDEKIAGIGIHLLHVAIKLDPDRYYILGNLRLAKFEEKRKRGVPVKYYRKVIQADPKHEEAREFLEDWHKKHDIVPVNTPQARRLLAKVITLVLELKYPEAYENLQAIEDVPPGDPMPIPLDRFRIRVYNAVRAGRKDTFLSEAEERNLRIYLLHLKAASDNPFDPPGKKLPRLGERIFDLNYDTTKTRFRFGKFVK